MRKYISKRTDLPQPLLLESIKPIFDSLSTNVSFLNMLNSKDSIMSVQKDGHSIPLFSSNDKQNSCSMTFFNNAQATSTSCEKNKHGESLDGSRPKFNFKKKPKDSLASTHKKSMEGMVLIPPELKIDLSTKEQRSSSQSSKKEAKSIPHHFRQLVGSTQQQKIKVYVRIKPNELPNQHNSLNIINGQTVKLDSNYFVFDQVFNSVADQETIFQKVGQEICDKLFEGYNGTIFAYGQTGSGKTYTIFGEDQTKNQHGLIYRAITHILTRKSKDRPQIKVKCSMVQLYKEDFIDMFAGHRQLKLKETKNAGVYIEGLKEVTISSQNEMMCLVREASKNRKVASTKINQQSSRSHTILSIYLQEEKFSSKLCLIDLAGSEKVSKSEVNGASFEQTKKINYSLSCLGNVINALTTRRQCDHIPFRDSKLTRVLKDSLTGNFLTSIIVNCSNSQLSVHQTLSSLKFAERAKKIKMTVHGHQPTVECESIDYLRSVINQLNIDLQQTKKELSKYKDSQRSQIAQLNSSKQKMIISLPVRTQSKVQGKEGDQDLSGRNPIPSERANVEESIRRYLPNPKVIRSRRMSVNLQDISSLNVSKTMHNFGENACPSLSSLSLRYDDSPDLSLSFSIHCDQEQRRTSGRWLQSTLHKPQLLPVPDQPKP